jgi:polysaccharide biosynthesis transport protein
MTEDMERKGGTRREEALDLPRWGHLDLPARSTENSVLTWEQVVRTLRKHRWLLMGVVIGVTAISAGVAFSMRDVYQPTARLEIDPLENGIRTLHEIESPAAQSDSDYLDTQVQILQSDGLAMRAIRALKLDRNPEFTGKNDALADESKDSEVSQGNPGLQPDSSFFREQLDLAESTPSEATALRIFHRGLSVNPVRGSRLVEVSFTSHDSRLAQKVTNTLVSQFIDQNYRNRYVTTMEASEWLSAQLNDLRQKVSESNQAVAEYQKKYGLVESDDRDVPLSQLMSDVSKQLSDAQADRIQSEAYARMIDLGQGDGIPAVRNDPVYQGLLTHYGEVRAQLAQAQAVYGEESANVKKLQNEADELAAQVNAERTLLINKVRTAFTAALARETMMLESRDKLKAQMGDVSSHLVEYQMLKNEALAKASLYNTLEARLKEAGIYAGLHSGNIHVVDMAPVLHEPTSPHRKLIVASGLGLSLLLALAVVFVQESFDNTVRIPDDIRNWIHLPTLAVLPRVSSNELLPGSRTGRGESILHSTLSSGKQSWKPRVFWSQTQTAEAEAIRALRNSLVSVDADSRRQVILVSSANEGEGKTTVALNLASVLASQHKTCLVEGDLRVPAIGLALGVQPKTGLVEVLLGKANLQEALVAAPEIPGLAVLCAKSLPRNPADLAASQEMRSVIAQLRQTFDYVVIDSPPAIPFSEASSLASVSDAVIIVSRYGHTTRRAVSRAAELLDDGRARVAGVVLNDIDTSSADFHYFNYGYSWKISRRYSAYAKRLQAKAVQNGFGEPEPPKSRSAHA